MGDLHASSIMSMPGQGQGLDLAQAVHALQSTLMDFQRRNEEAQRRTEESQAAMFHALNAIVVSGNGDKQANGMMAQQALEMLRTQQISGQPQHSLLSQASGSAQGKTSTQKQLLHLLQALQSSGSDQLGSNFAEQMLSRAASGAVVSPAPDFGTIERSHSSPMHTSTAARRPTKQQNGHSSPTLGSYRAAHDYMHSNGVQSSPVVQQKKRSRKDQSAAVTAHSIASQSRARNPLTTGSSAINAQSPILGGLTPGYEADYLSGPSPTYSAAEVTGRDAHPMSSHHSSSSSSANLLRPKMNQNKPLACCYNCGETSEQYWQYLNLPPRIHVRFAAESACMIDGVKNHRACSPCGTFYVQNNGISRPEFVWRESNGKRKEKLKRAIEGSRADAVEVSEVPKSSLERTKKSSFARTLSEACEIDAKRKTPDPTSSDNRKSIKKVKKEAEEKAESKASASRKSRKGSSDEKSKSMTDSDDDGPSSSSRERVRHKSPPKCVYDFSKARLRDFVMDPHGRWRTKRSILENPSGRKVGRPAGIKTGEGEGRQRNNPQKRVEALLQAYEEMDKVKLMNSNLSREEEEAMEASAPAPRSNRRRPGSKAASAAKSDVPMHDEDAITMDALQAFMSASSPVLSHSQRMQNAPHAAANFAHPGSTQSKLPHAALGQSFLPNNVHKTPSGMGAIRYGAPAHLMNSSPATAFQTVMDEADTDWKALFGFGGRSQATAGVRRSPRKKPVGTQAMVNPYATSIVSPSGLPKNAHTGLQSGPIEAAALMHMTSSSPLTRSRVKSGQFEWAWGSSDAADGLTAGLRNDKISSAITSPSSPSPQRPRNKQTKRKADSMLEAGVLSSSSGGQSSSDSGSRLTKQQKGGIHSAAAAAAAANAVLNAGPFMGLQSSDDARVDEEEVEEEGLGSPTLGRSRRLGKKKNESRLNSVADGGSTRHNTPTAAAALDLAPSNGMSTCAATSGVPMADLQSEWARATTMGELFPNLSPDKRWNAASPSQQALWNSPTSWALRMPTPSPVKAMLGAAAKDAASARMATAGNIIDTPIATNAGNGDVQTAISNLLQVQESNSNKPSPKTASHSARTKRKPLPATVEDATPSDAIATPHDGEEEYDEDDDDEEEEEGDDVDVTAFQGAEGNALVFDVNSGANLADLMKMFDDPYGFLSATGLNAQGAADKSVQQQPTISSGTGALVQPTTVEQHRQASTTATSASEGGAGSSSSSMPSNAELAQMDLFKDFDFTQQLAFFNETSANATAAADSAPSSTTPKMDSRPLRTSPRKRNQQQNHSSAIV